MKPVKILHYVEKSYENRPSFIILMSDNKEYISNGCVFVENTEEQIKCLIRAYKCKREIGILLSAPSIDNDKLVNGYCMFKGCKNITEPGDYPLLKAGAWMYCGCENLIEPGDYPLLKDGYYMYHGCRDLTKIGSYPLLVRDYLMYRGCPKIEEQQA